MCSRKLIATQVLGSMIAMCVVSSIGGCGDYGAIEWDAGDDGTVQGGGSGGSGGTAGEGSNGGRENGGSENGGSGPGGGTGGAGSSDTGGTGGAGSSDTGGYGGSGGGDVGGAGCIIDGKAYAQGTKNPANDCKVCAPTNSTDWSNVSPGSSCNQVGGNTCNNHGACVMKRVLGLGNAHSCGTTPAGAVMCWGTPGSRLGNPSSGYGPLQAVGLSTGVIAVAGGSLHTCALTLDGAVLCWGANTKGQLGNGTTVASGIPYPVPGFEVGARAVSAARGESTCVVDEAGAVWCWGDNADGQLGNGGTVGTLSPGKVIGLESGYVAVGIGSRHACALNSQGGVKCWGANALGQVGNGLPDKIFTAPEQVAGLESGVVDIVVGSEHTCVITSGGQIKCWGLNGWGQCGVPTSATMTPTTVPGLTAIAAVSAGYSHTCAVTKAGGVMCWGRNASGQLGDGTTEVRPSPTPVKDISIGVVAVMGGSEHTCAYTSENKAMCWGSNVNRMLGNGTNTDSLTPVEVIGFP